MGSSKCRMCGRSNSGGEYELLVNNVKYIVPGGYLHYLKKHNVHPSKDFIDFMEPLILTE